MLTKIKELVRGEEGQGMAEYGLILALVSIAAIIALTTIGDQLKLVFEKVKTELTI